MYVNDPLCAVCEQVCVHHRENILHIAWVVGDKPSGKCSGLELIFKVHAA